MRKDDLIKKLQDIPGNPQVMIWNGYIHDVQHISKLSNHRLTKIKREEYIKFCVWQKNKEKVLKLDRKPIPEDWDQVTEEEIEKLKQSYSEYVTWELDSGYPDDVLEKKNILVIEPKRSGKTTFDRLGDIEY